LRQRDPLALLLFLIAAEGLARVVRIAVKKNMVESLEVGAKKFKINMLQNVDEYFVCLQSGYQKCV